MPAQFRFLSKILLTSVIAILTGCAEPKTTQKAATQTSTGSQFQAISEQFITDYLAWRPQSGTSLGFHQYDGKVTDYSKASISNELAKLKGFQAELGRLDAKALSRQEFFDYQLLRSAIAREVFSFEGLDIYTRNPMTYATALDINIYIKRDFAPFPERVRSIIAILKTAPVLFASARENLEEHLPKPHVETAIEETSGAIDFLNKDLVNALKSLRDEMLHTELLEAKAIAVRELRAYVGFLKTEKLPKATDDFALGAEKYRELLETGEMITTPAERLLDIGMAELRSKQRIFTETARRIDPARPAIDVFKAIQKDHPTEQSLIPDVSRDLDRIRSFVLAHDLVTIPSNVRATVAETPQFLRATSFASMDTPGPFETKAREAYYYVTPTEQDWSTKQKEEWLTAFNYYTTDIVSIHEAYPGHYVQFLCLNASPATRIEKIFGSYAFVEGWAHYAEQMMVDEGFGASAADGRAADKYLLAQTDEALLRACRLCVSIQMHCHGMSAEQATKFFQDNCYYEEKPAHEEAMRGAFDPEYLYYTVGKLEFLKLREDYKRQEGASYSLKKFHDAVLRHGEPPLRLLREALLKDAALWERVL